MNSRFHIRIDLRHKQDAAEQRQVRTLLLSLQQTAVELEARLTRFASDSELSQLNSRVGQTVTISTLLDDVLQLTARAYELTSGVFDPRVISDLQRLGYVGHLPTGPWEQTSSAERMQKNRLGTPPIQWCGVCQVRVDAPIELGGIGKGYTADRLATIIESSLAADQLAGYLVSAGGDVVVRGQQESGEPWHVGVENPQAPERLIAVAQMPARRQAICTSSRFKRTWQHRGRAVHHLIDPATGEPCASTYLAVTAQAEHAAFAEILTKLVFLRGPMIPAVTEFGDPHRIFTVQPGQIVSYTDAMQAQLQWLDPAMKVVRFYSGSSSTLEK